MRRWPSILLALTLLGTSVAQNNGKIDSAQYYERGMNALLGTGVSHNDQTALQALRTSAELGYLPAQTAVGYFYDTGTIVTRDPVVTVKIFIFSLIVTTFLSSYALAYSWTRRRSLSFIPRSCVIRPRCAAWPPIANAAVPAYWGTPAPSLWDVVLGRWIRIGAARRWCSVA